MYLVDILSAIFPIRNMPNLYTSLLSATHDLFYSPQESSNELEICHGLILKGLCMSKLSTFCAKEKAQ